MALTEDSFSEFELYREKFLILSNLIKRNHQNFLNANWENNHTLNTFATFFFRLEVRNVINLASCHGKEQL